MSKVRIAPNQFDIFGSCAVLDAQEHQKVMKKALAETGRKAPEQSAVMESTSVESKGKAEVDWQVVAEKHALQRAEEIAFQQRAYRLGEVVYNPYLDTLNPPQREAVEYGEGPLLVIAGAGSGKTRVLTYRIAQLIARGVPPQRILALTFTNKAASEMKERIGKAIGADQAKVLWMGTFHSIFSRCIRRDAHVLGFRGNISIYDTDDTKKLLKDILAGFKLDYDVKDIQRKVSMLKNACITSDQYEHRADLRDYDAVVNMSEFYRVYQAYAVRLRQNNAMDFDDLLLMMYALLTEPAYRHERMPWETYWDYVLVDEFQDTNTLQLEILNHLSRRSGNLNVVGDDAQSIYAFRGANIGNILGFTGAYGDQPVKEVKLEQNYRSTPAIVEASNQLIRFNTRQLVKRVFTDSLDSEAIVVLPCADENEEAQTVVEQILNQKTKTDWEWGDFAVLYRTRMQALDLEYELRRKQIPYKIINGTSFFSRQEIRDSLALLRLTTNPSDSEALRRCLARPSRSVGDTTVSKIQEAARDYPLLEVLAAPGRYIAGLKQKSIDGIVHFRSQLDDYIRYTQGHDAGQCVGYILEKSGLMAYYRNEDKKVAKGKAKPPVGRADYLRELLAGVNAFVVNGRRDKVPDSELTLVHYMQYVSLMTAGDEAGDANTVSLMTVHASKGLEFNHVQVVGLEEELFPYTGFEQEEGVPDLNRNEKGVDRRKASPDDGEGPVKKARLAVLDSSRIEEERRLCYVAVTRAKRRLVLSYCLSRQVGGKEKSRSASRFLLEMDLLADE